MSQLCRKGTGKGEESASLVFPVRNCSSPGSLAPPGSIQLAIQWLIVNIIGLYCHQGRGTKYRYCYDVKGEIELGQGSKMEQNVFGMGDMGRGPQLDDPWVRNLRIPSSRTVPFLEPLPGRKMYI